MKTIVVILSLLLTMPGFAQEWTSYTNERYGAIADVPPGFVPAGPEANNSDGLIFRSRAGGFLTIFGADVPGKDFDAFIDKLIANEGSYNSFPVTGVKATNEWAEYWGSRGPQKLRVRILSSCGGRQAVVTRFVFAGNLESVVDRVERSLTAGPAHSC
jgi:hypothetical protein